MAAPLVHSGATVNTMTRLTRENRKLTYRLRVIQQPERARACGSGAKSSADRRPVDPPPVVELRIFEGDTNTDITFSHNANFVLFATLEQARPIAHGRVPQSASQAPSPVLTGIPVSSMAYLDRPEPAGYFIFPDLSVRHEGKYKLVFNLYEEVKDPKDEDAEPAANHPEHPDNKQKSREPQAPQEFQHWRLEVQSNPFSVFSAKKFPGLAESTALSRIVAEQGCRVRIRRDVRMRRRDNKSSKDYDDYDDEPSYPPAPESAAGEGYQDRQRAPSDANAADFASAHRRQSAHESTGGYYNQPQQQQQQPYQQPPYQAATPTAAPSQAPAPPQAPPAPTAFATPQPAPQHYGAPRYSQSAAPAPPAAQPYAEGQYSYPEQQPQHYSYPQRAEVEQYPARAESIDSKPAPGTEWRQSAYPAPPQVSTYPEKYAYGHPNYNGYMQPPAAPRAPTPSSTTSALPPLKMPLPVEPKYENAASPSAGQGVPQQQQPAVPLPSPAYDSASSSRYSQQYPPSTPVTGNSERSTKRSFGAVFESSHFDQSLTNGSRPNDAYYGADLMQPDYDEDDSSSPYEHPVKMQYKRADGTEISRRLTGHC